MHDDMIYYGEDVQMKFANPGLCIMGSCTGGSGHDDYNDDLLTLCHNKQIQMDYINFILYLLMMTHLSN